MDELKLIFASNLIRLRTAAGMTQAELAERLHYSDKSVSKWERGEAIPDVYVLMQIGEIFSLSLDQLLSADNSWKKEVRPYEETQTYSRAFIVLCTIAGIWMLCMLEFVVVWMLFDTISWIVFIVALPISLTVLLVFNSVWFRGRYNMYIVMALVLCLILLIYLSALKLNLWQLFLLLVPAELVVFLAFNIRKGRGKCKKRGKKAGKSAEKQ